MKKVVRILIVLFSIILIFTMGFTVFCIYKDREYGKTIVNADYTAEQTVDKYIEYWNSGNNFAMKKLVSDDADVKPNNGEKNFIPSLYFFCDVSHSDLMVLTEKAKNYDDYYQSSIVTTNFSYSGSWGFGDKELNQSNQKVEFHLVKEDENSSWKIISWSK